MPTATTTNLGMGGGKAPSGTEYNGQGVVVPITPSNSVPPPTNVPTPTTPVTTLTSPSSLTSLPNLAPGASGDAVSKLQNYLVSQGFLKSGDLADGGAGSYGPKTTAAVAAWQKAMGIDTKGNPGYFGPISKAYLSNPTQPPAGGPIAPAQATPQSSLNITDPTSTPSNGLTAAATSTMQSISDILASLNTPDTDAQTSEKDITAKLSDLMNKDLGKDADTAAEMTNAGVPDLKKQLTAKNAEISMLTAQKNQLDAEEEGKPITMDSIIGAKAQIGAVMDAKIGVATAEAQAIMGNISVATDTANAAVDAKYGPIEEEIKIRQQQLQLLQPTLDEDEKKQATAQQEYLDEQQQQIQDTKDAEKQTQQTLIGWMGDYPDAGINLKDTVESAQAKIVKSKSFQTQQQNNQRIAGGSGDSGGSGPGSTAGGKSNFTQTQLNKGAANAGISLDDFNRLDPDSQNVFINNSSDLDAFKKTIDSAKTNGGTGNSPQELEAEIDDPSSNLPKGVQDYLVKYLHKVFGDYGAAAPAKPWWQFW